MVMVKKAEKSKVEKGLDRFEKIFDTVTGGTDRLGRR
jgi:hypothetical protein